MNPNNPLNQYFRQPAIYIKLPSGGNYYPPGALDMPQTGEIPVLPMTAIDEITYRTPDALFSGQAVVNVIQSCIPNIKDAWTIPSVDIDTILVAIRIATYGHNMEFATTCPKCNNTSDYGLDLRTVLGELKSPDYKQPIKSGDIEIYFKPMTYKNLSDNNKIQYDEQRIFQSIPAEGDVDPKQVSAMSAALQKMTEITVTALAQSIMTIKTPSALVSESDYIIEFMKNCDRSIFNRIQDYVIEHKAEAEMKPLSITCTECKNVYSQTITLDMTNFFERAS
jgi:T4 bacteriophage base plate protein